MFAGHTDIQFIESYTLLERLVKLFMSISVRSWFLGPFRFNSRGLGLLLRLCSVLVSYVQVIFFTDSQWASPIIVFLAELILLYACYTMRPCQV